MYIQLVISPFTFSLHKLCQSPANLYHHPIHTANVSQPYFLGMKSCGAISNHGNLLCRLYSQISPLNDQILSIISVQLWKAVVWFMGIQHKTHRYLNKLGCWWQMAYWMPSQFRFFLTHWEENIKADILQIAFSLTHWGRHKMDPISRTPFSNGFSWMKMFEYWLKFHWNLFLRIQLTIFEHWLR